MAAVEVATDVVQVDVYFAVVGSAVAVLLALK